MYMSACCVDIIFVYHSKNITTKNNFFAARTYLYYSFASVLIFTVKIFYISDDASGSSLDWYLEKLDVPYVFGFEVYPAQNFRGNGFINVTPRDIVPTGKEVSEAIIVAAENIRV